MSAEDQERVQLLDAVMNQGIRALSRDELERLQFLLEQKDYGHDTKAQKSKTKLLKKVSAAIYNYEKKHGNSFKTNSGGKVRP